MVRDKVTRVHLKDHWDLQTNQKLGFPFGTESILVMTMVIVLLDVKGWSTIFDIFLEGRNGQINGETTTENGTYDIEGIISISGELKKTIIKQQRLPTTIFIVGTILNPRLKENRVGGEVEIDEPFSYFKKPKVNEIKTKLAQLRQ